MVDMADLENADEDTNFILAWGAFHSKPEEATRLYKQHYPKIKIGLCIGGNANPPYDVDIWDILFYETRWYYKEFLQWYE